LHDHFLFILQNASWSTKSKLFVSAIAAGALLSGIAVTNKTYAVAPKAQLNIAKHMLLAQRKGYDKLSDHTLSIYQYSHVVEPDTETVLTVATCTDCSDLKWTVEAIDDNGSVVYDETSSGNTLHAVFSRANAQFSIKVEQNGVTLLEEVAICKYVRRELRTVSKADLERFFKALKIMYSTDQETGEALYGQNYISAAHMTANHNTNEFVYHGNLFFVTSHPTMQIRFEKSLLSIDPSVVLNYWDFLLDHQLGRDWASSPIYSDEMFGPVSTLAENDYRPSGYFHDVELVYDPEKKAFPNAFHNPHGFLGSGEMTTSIKYLTRSDEYCGFKSIEGQVTCTNLVGCFDKFEAEHNLREFDICLEEKVHANLHMMVSYYYCYFASFF
jgi:hypothetical protein